MIVYCFFFFFQAEDGIRDATVTGVQTCALPISKDSLVGYLRIFCVVAAARANESPTGNPFSARSIASESTCAEFIVPQRSSRMNQASMQPRTVPESNESFTRSLPPLCSLYHSMVASFGAVPCAF